MLLKNSRRAPTRVSSGLVSRRHHDKCFRARFERPAPREKTYLHAMAELRRHRGEDRAAVGVGWRKGRTPFTCEVNRMMPNR